MLVVANIVPLAAGTTIAGWMLLPLVPLAAVNWLGWWKTCPPKPCPDYPLIASLEQELLGIVPEKPQPPPGPGAATTAK